MYSHFDFTSWVTPFGLMFITAIFIAWFFARRSAVAVGVDPSHIDLLIPITIIVGVVGGTAVAILTSVDDGIRVRLFAILGFGALAVFIYSHIAKVSFRGLLDVFALPVLAALMVHRIGCFLAGCCWGDVVSHEQGVVQGVQFPPGSLAFEQHVWMNLINPGALASLPVYPVQLYEAGLLQVLLLVLWRLPRRSFSQGVLAIVTICSYAVIRFFIEYLRADGSVVFGNLTVTQLLCIFLLLCIVLLPRARNSVVSFNRSG